LAILLKNPAKNFTAVQNMKYTTWPMKVYINFTQ